MIIAGNSHVSVFKHGLRLPEKAHESVSVHWVGALEIEHFNTQHPAAQKIRSLFEQETGWKILLLGTHDMFKLAASSTRDLALEALLSQYQQIFSELGARGRFAWMIGLQQTRSVAIPGVSEQDLIRLSGRFVERLTEWCQANDIPVINPLPKILDATGHPLPGLMMTDQLHLKPIAAPLYCEEIKATTGEEVESNPTCGLDFEPHNEPESFCSLVLAELGLPPGNAGRSPNDPAFSEAVLAVVHERLAERGLEVSLDEDSDFVSSGLMDSLDLVETYAFATDWLAIDIPFDVNLLELGTVRKLVTFLRDRMPPAPPSGEPTWQDVYRSLREDFSTPEGRARILAAEQRIASLATDRYRLLIEVLQTVTGGHLGYGIMLHWMALIEHRAGNLERAFELLDQAEASPKSEPLTLDRIDHYRKEWLAFSPGDLPDRRAVNFLLVDDGTERLANTVECYLQTFMASEDVALHVVSSRDTALVQQPVLDTIGRLGQDPEQIPDVCLLSLPSNTDLAPFIQQVDLVIGGAEVVASANQLGVQACMSPSADQFRQVASRPYLVSAVISAYNCERFLKERLDNLINQTLYALGRLEIIVVDSASPQDERSIVETYMQRHDHIRYFRTPERETVYGAWNRGLEQAKGKYWINANSDDRFALDALEVMASELEAAPGLDAVYGDWAVTTVENDALDSVTPKFVFSYPEFQPALFLYYQITSHAALVRKSAFERIGGYDESLRVFGDREWMLRFALQGSVAKHMPRVVGLYLESPTSVERSESVGANEFRRIRERFSAPREMSRLLGLDSVPEPSKLAELYAIAGSMGHEFYRWRDVPVSDYVFATHCCQEALRLNPDNVQALSNLGIILCLSNQHALGVAHLERAARQAPAGFQAAIQANLTAAKAGNTQPGAFHWQYQAIPPGVKGTQSEQIDIPLVSVIVPTFNRPDMLREALESILSQTYQNIEIIVVNDGGEPVEATLARLDSKEKITYLRLGRNHERSYARNCGLEVARGKYIAYLDDDDRFYPDHIETLVDYLEKHDCQVAYTDAYMAHQVKRGELYHTVKRELVYSNDFDLQKLLVLNLAPTLCFMHERACLDEVGLFDESLSTHEDWEFWIRLACRFTVHHVPKVTAEFSWRIDGSSTVSSRRASFLQSLELVYERYHHMSTPETLAGQERYRAFQHQEAEKVGQRYAVSLILRTGDREHTQRCLEAIAEHTVGEYEVIVLDDQRHPECQELLQALGGDVKVVSDPAFQCASAAFNRGAALAEGHYLLFLESDTEPHAGWLEPLQRALDEDPGLAATGGFQRYPDGSPYHAGLLVTENRSATRTLAVRTLSGDASPLAPLALTANGLLVRKSSFQEVGGFSEALGGHWAGADLCLRLRAKPLRIAFVPKSRLTLHRRPALPVQTEAASFTRRWLDRIVPDRLITERGVERPHPKRSRVSLVVVTYNSSDTIEACVHSALATMGPQDEIIVVDNASQDATPAMLRSLAADDKRMRCFVSGENLGFSAGSNLGIQRSRGDYVVLLNPDTVVYPGWLDHMVGLFMLPDVGAVGPTSDYVAGHQKWPLYAADLPLDTAPERIADRLAMTRANQGVETKLLIGFCLMLSRTVLDRIGLLDEELFLGNDDLDLSWRLQQAGYRLMVATGAFVHHVGQVSFNSEPGEHTRRLVQESTDALARKLVRHYGPGFVPSPQELWEMSWFTPSPGILDRAELEAPAPTEASDDSAPVRWLVSSSEDWEAALTAYLVAVRPDQDIALLIRVDAGDEQRAELRIAEWLVDRGYDPGAIPDVLIVSDETSPIALFRAATAWIENGNAADRTMASDFGLPIIPPTVEAMRGVAQSLAPH